MRCAARGRRRRSWYPGAAGHAAQTAPRGLTLLFDWLHVAAGSVWLGGLVGLLVLWFSVSSRERVAVLSVRVPRFSNVAVASVIVLGATGVGEAINHMPAVNALWETSYGQAILVKAGLLGGAMLIASGNLLRSRPRLIAARRRPEVGEPAARLLRGLVSGELVIVVGVVFAAAVLSSLPPPPPAFALENSAIAKVGPGRVAETVAHAGYVLQVLVSPNKAAAPDSFALRITKGGQPVRGASVTLLFNHLEMEMPTQEYQLDRDIAGDLLARRAGVRDGRPLGADVPGNPKARPAVHRADRRPGRRMRPLTLTDQNGGARDQPSHPLPETPRRIAIGGLLAAVLLAGCGGAGSGLTVPQVAPARVYSLGGFQPSGPIRAGHPVTVTFTVRFRAGSR